jgi:DNA-binding response OmpR family regulator
MSKTILTIDDSASIRQMVTLTLASAGYTVIEAVDGADRRRTAARSARSGGALSGLVNRADA